MAEAASHAAAIAQAIKASGVVVRVETPDFLRLFESAGRAHRGSSPRGFLPSVLAIPDDLQGSSVFCRFQ